LNGVALVQRLAYADRPGVRRLAVRSESEIDGIGEERRLEVAAMKRVSARLCLLAAVPMLVFLPWASPCSRPRLLVP
jgi:hypothetical protein